MQEDQTPADSRTKHEQKIIEEAKESKTAAT